MSRREIGRRVGTDEDEQKGRDCHRERERRDGGLATNEHDQADQREDGEEEER